MEELAKVYNPRDVEDRVYTAWEEKGYFHAKPNAAKKAYAIVIPPPNITGILHMGHALNNTLQDILIRFRRMQGFEAEWMPGTDHAGIATQNVVERRLAKEGKKREDLGREKFVEEVWKWRQVYGSTIIRQLKKLGCSCDWERTRFTMDETLSDAVLEVFIRLYEKGLIYKGNYIINWCPRCQTALSDEESQHKDVEGMLYYVKYPVRDDGSGVRGQGSGAHSGPLTPHPTPHTMKAAHHVVIATTRPETMLGDVAIAVNPKDKRYKDLKDKVVLLPLINRELKVIYDPIVDMKFGTGALKVTPAHDPVDFGLGMKYGLEQINVMNQDATINERGGAYVGMDRLQAREAILADLKERGLFVKCEPHRHAIGHCYRCHTMVEPRLSPQWFVKMKPLAKPALKAVKDGTIKFYPDRWTKVYINWMENIRDWCISRQIWWGHRLPVYYCKNCMKQANRSMVDSQWSIGKEKTIDHRPSTIDKTGIIVSKTRPEKCPECGSTDLEQDPDVLDTWFSSWLWPFSTFGWPKESPDLKYFYPTDSLITAQEILFFWVARMIMAGCEFLGAVPFRSVYIHGTVRDITGTKMSKSLGNVIDPIDMIAQYGTDALRYSIISITAQGQDVFLSESKFELGRNFANKIWNASRFILMNLKPDQIRVDLCQYVKGSQLSFADKWILSRFYSTLDYVTKSLDAFKFNEAAGAVYEFFWHSFCDWYIEIVKMSIGERTTQVILYKILEKSLRLLHPLMPFITEEIWQKIPHDGESIMTSPWPHVHNEMIDPEGEARMALVIEVITAIRNIRAVWNIEQQRQVEVIINLHEKGNEQIVRNNETMIKRLARASVLKLGVFAKPKNAASSVVKTMEIFVPLEGLIDFAKERARLEKEKARMEQELAGLTGRLKDKNFLSKAPEEVVEKQKVRKEELKIQVKKIEAHIKEMS